MPKKRRTWNICILQWSEFFSSVASVAAIYCTEEAENLNSLSLAIYSEISSRKEKHQLRKTEILDFMDTIKWVWWFPKAWCSTFFSVANTTEFAINAILFCWRMHHQHHAYDEVHVLNAASNIRDGSHVDISSSSCDVNVRRRNGNIRILTSNKLKKLS